MAAFDFLKRIAPGQSGALSQGPGNWQEIRVKLVRAESIQFTFAKGSGEGHLAPGEPALFQTISEGGVLRCKGNLRNMNAAEVEFFPSRDEAPQIVNRREAFRVPVGLRGELAGTTRYGEDSYSTLWTCAFRDISVGGARMVLPSPGPAVRSAALLKVELPTEERPAILPCLIIEASPKKNALPMDALVRVTFHALNGRMENQLSRYINHVQIELMKKGVR